MSKKRKNARKKKSLLTLDEKRGALLGHYAKVLVREAKFRWEHPSYFPVCEPAITKENEMERVEVELTELLTVFHQMSPEELNEEYEGRFQ